MARRVADRTLRSDVTGGRPRAVVLTIVRRGSCDCALRLFLEEGTKRTNRERAPAHTGGGACFRTQGGSITVPSPIRARVRVLERGLLPDYFCGGAGTVRPAWRLAQAFFAARQAGRHGAACGVRLTGLFSWRGGARRGCHTARALAVRGRPAAWRGVWLARLFCGGAAGGAMGARRGRRAFFARRMGLPSCAAARRGRAGKTKTA